MKLVFLLSFITFSCSTSFVRPECKYYMEAKSEEGSSSIDGSVSLLYLIGSLFGEVDPSVLQYETVRYNESPKLNPYCEQYAYLPYEDSTNVAETDCEKTCLKDYQNGDLANNQTFLSCKSIICNSSRAINNESK